MTLDPRRLDSEPALLEEIEKATLRMVTQAIYDFRDEASEFFVHEPDAVADIGEDITREAMDRMGTSIIPARLFGRIDYKRARYVFHPEYSVRQALFIDSKAEQVAGARTVTIQTSQTSMSIRQMRSGQPIDEQGTLPRVLQLQGIDYLVTTYSRSTTTWSRQTGPKSRSIAFPSHAFPMGCFRKSTIQHPRRPYGLLVETLPVAVNRFESGSASID